VPATGPQRASGDDPVSPSDDLPKMNSGDSDADIAVSGHHGRIFPCVTSVTIPMGDLAYCGSVYNQRGLA
jgi:hypothetical protein